jgi:hypothetical protein
MALQTVLSVDSNQVVSGQMVRFALTVVNPSNGTACNITQIAPRIGVPGAGTAAGNIGRPLLQIPEAPLYIGAGSSATFTWTEALFTGQLPQAQSNAPANALPLTMTADVFTTDSTGVYTPATVLVDVYPNVMLNANTAFTLPAVGSALFYDNKQSWIAGLLSAPVPL